MGKLKGMGSTFLLIGGYEAVIDDDIPNREADTEEFQSLFGGLVPIGNRDASKENVFEMPTEKLFIVEEGQLNHCGKLFHSESIDCGVEIYIWTGRGISLEERKIASVPAEEDLSSQNKPKSRENSFLNVCVAKNTKKREEGMQQIVQEKREKQSSAAHFCVHRGEETACLLPCYIEKKEG